MSSILGWVAWALIVIGPFVVTALDERYRRRNRRKP